MTIPELIEKLEKATGPDRDLDEAISAALFPQHEFMQLKDAPKGVGCVMYRWPDGQQVSALRATSSIDAGVKLCELVLPDFHWTVYSRCHEHGPRAVLVSPEFRKQFGENGKTPVLALLITILRALQPKEGE